jgi:hypothetical protein
MKRNLLATGAGVILAAAASAATFDRDLLAQAEIEDAKTPRGEEFPGEEIVRPAIQRDIVDAFRRGATLDVSQQPRGDALATRAGRDREVMHVEAQVRGGERRFRHMLKFEPGVADQAPIRLGDDGRRQARCEEVADRCFIDGRPEVPGVQSHMKRLHRIVEPGERVEVGFPCGPCHRRHDRSLDPVGPY